MVEIDWRRIPSLSALRALEATARLNGFSAAARSLNVTPAAVAQQVRGLEAELGVQLVTRQGRAVVMTEEGAVLTAALQQGFSTIASAITRTKDSRSNRPVRVSTTGGIGQWVLMPALQEFWAQHPDVRVSLDIGSTPADLPGGAVDLAIRAGTPDQTWPDTISEPLIQSRYILVAAPALADQINAGSDLATLPWVLDEGHESEAEWLRHLGLSRENLRVTDVASASLAINSVLQGYGVTFSVERIIASYIESGQLIRLPADWLPPVTYHLVTARRPLTAQAALFRDWVRDTLRQI